LVQLTREEWGIYYVVVVKSEFAKRESFFFFQHT